MQMKANVSDSVVSKSGVAQVQSVGEKLRECYGYDSFISKKGDWRRASGVWRGKCFIWVCPEAEPSDAKLMWERSRETLMEVGSEREKEGRFIKGALLKSCNCGQPHRGLWKQPRARALEFLRQRLEGTGVSTLQLQPASG